MSEIQVMLSVGLPEKQKEDPAEQYKCSVEDQVREALDLIDSCHDSYVEWNMIRRLYRDLRSRPSSPRVDNLINMIEPVLHKYGFFGNV